MVLLLFVLLLLFVGWVCYWQSQPLVERIEAVASALPPHAKLPTWFGLEIVGYAAGEHSARCVDCKIAYPPIHIEPTRYQLYSCRKCGHQKSGEVLLSEYRQKMIQAREKMIQARG